MSSYLIDPVHKEVHHTSFIGDQCKILQISLEKRVKEYSSEVVDSLCENNGFKRCTCCKGLKIKQPVSFASVKGEIPS
ncbi:hypothetical protein [Thalassobacillus sp. C254]|uniref:hypothetical protein n=1 Tax=Thalassobacillus sp. C254 TaxID=1225341 RepID=UPI0006D1FBEB|nr:hypothetical protein [Thalassobacillus sp. C254]